MKITTEEQATLQVFGLRLENFELQAQIAKRDQDVYLGVLMSKYGITHDNPAHINAKTGEISTADGKEWTKGNPCP